MITKLWALPVCVALLLPGTFFLTYTIAVINEHVQPFIPYISDTGSYPPESCIFAQLLNTSCLLIGLVMYFRHRQIVEFYRHASQSAHRFIICSNIILWVGYTSAFGISLVGNFPQTAFMLVHVAGAFLAFGFGLSYCWGQTVFSYRMTQVFQKRTICHFRLLLTCIGTLCFFMMSGIGFNPLYNITPQRTRTYNDCALWEIVFIQPGDQGYIEHQITTACEWIMALMFVAYFGTYAVELRHAYLIPPLLKLTVGHSELPTDSGTICQSALLSLKMEQKSPVLVKGGNLHFPEAYKKAKVKTVSETVKFGNRSEDGVKDSMERTKKAAKTTGKFLLSKKSGKGDMPEKKAEVSPDSSTNQSSS